MLASSIDRVPGTHSHARATTVPGLLGLQIRLLRQLKHPVILTLFDTFLSSDGRLVCLTTTYCESGDLAKVIKHAAKTRSPLSEKAVMGWFAQVGVWSMVHAYLSWIPTES